MTFSYKKPCIVITRPEEDAIYTAEVLKRLGFSPFIEPVIKIEFMDFADAVLENIFPDYSGIIITSRNALRAILRKTRSGENRFISMPSLIVLGKSTFTFAQSQGLKSVYGGENVKALAEYIKTHYYGLPLAYFSGETVSTELGRVNCGADVTRLVVYRAVCRKTLSENFKSGLKNGEFSGIMFFSLRSVRAFMNALSSGEAAFCGMTRAFCLSRNIADYAARYNFKTVKYAENPDMESMEHLLVNFQFTD